MSQKVKEKAKKFYPDNWSKEYLKALVEKGALTPAEYKEVTGEEYQP